MSDKKESKVVDTTKRVEVTATKDHPYVKEGVKIKVGVLQVDNLKAKGFIK
ncbi:hypothetical protein ORI89_07540 [Sphingobacterium sp. UT-1RO-CII-1]|uniref:hypothetical protein n=1 Tax=Sphingobacterium sp. UT-1RO-CII-1 TaxID=2995225 RepID=UPI00227BD878|nr:hypothetical protein [Sphingobacterium sp. UT-1RO-CII-1]MCY4779498.1 hypothetical protein [Sphingobacterium sp. UT-1RO-CII-1]